MSELTPFKPIGEILQEASLITIPQLEVALRDQIAYEDMHLGEILALRGWVKQNTVDFFVQEWSKLLARKIEHPIGFYLRKAGLLTEANIQTILSEQNKLALRFGDIAVKQGLITSNTIDFFIEHLFPSHKSKNRLKRKDKITQDDITYWVTLSSQKVTEATGEANFI